MKNKYSSIIADYFYNRNNPPKIYLKKDYEKGSLSILAQQSFKLQSRYNIMEKRISKLEIIGWVIGLVAIGVLIFGIIRELFLK